MANEMKCLICGKSDPKGVYIRCIKDGKEAQVCAPCMPALIHGSESCH